MLDEGVGMPTTTACLKVTVISSPCAVQPQRTLLYLVHICKHTPVYVCIHIFIRAFFNDPPGEGGSGAKALLRQAGTFGAGRHPPWGEGGSGLGQADATCPDPPTRRRGNFFAPFLIKNCLKTGTSKSIFQALAIFCPLFGPFLSIFWSI